MMPLRGMLHCSFNPSLPISSPSDTLHLMSLWFAAQHAHQPGFHTPRPPQAIRTPPPLRAPSFHPLHLDL
eukprot:1149577-Pelagomonas_calceolata.AAC.2